MKCTYHGHSCFSFRIGETNIMFDPFFPSGVPDIVKSTECDYVFLTHAHADHIDGLEAVTQNKPKIVACFGLANMLEAEGFVNTVPCNPGLRFTEIQDVEIRAVPAVHSSGYKEKYDGIAMGYLLHTSNKTIYIAGDTSITAEMQILPEYYGSIDQAFLPIGGQFTMDWQDIPLASKLLQCTNIVGCHYDTFPAIEINKDEAIAYAQKLDIRLFLPEKGEVFSANE